MRRFSLREAAHGGDVRHAVAAGVRPVTDTYAAAAEDGLGVWAGSRRSKAGDCGDGAAVYNAWSWILNEGAAIVDIPKRCRGELELRSVNAFPERAVGSLPLLGRRVRLRDDPTAVEIAYSAALLPEDPMVPRRADDRGLFGTTSSSW